MVNQWYGAMGNWVKESGTNSKISQMLYVCIDGAVRGTRVTSEQVSNIFDKAVGPPTKDADLVLKDLEALGLDMTKVWEVLESKASSGSRVILTPPPAGFSPIPMSGPMGALDASSTTQAPNYGQPVPKPASTSAPAKVEGKKGWFGSKLEAAKAKLTWGKKEEPVAGGVGNAYSRPAAVTPAKPEKKSVAGSMIIWSAVALLFLIVLIGGGAVLLNNSFGVATPSEERNLNLEISGAQPLGFENDSEACSLVDGKVGIKTYYLRPLASVDGLSADTKYVAIRSSGNFVLAMDANTSVVLPVDRFASDFEVVCASTVSVQMLIDADKTDEVTQLVYKFNLSHWSSWFVLIAVIGSIGFALISLSMTGNNFVDIAPFLAATLFSVVAMGIISYFSSILSLPQVLAILPAEVLMKLALVIPAGYLISYFGPILWAVCSGSKSEIRQLSAQFESQGTLKVPDTVETVFLSLARGKGLIGGFDWSMGAQVTTVFMALGVVNYLLAPLYHLFGNRLWALFFESGLIAIFYLLENIRRGSKDGMKTWWLGFVGLLDPIILYLLVDSGMGPFDTKLAVIISLAISLGLFVLVLVANVGFQSRGERQELMRDMLGDNMAFYSAMKLAGIFAYILLQLM